MSFSFIHAADIHLDSPLIGLEHYEDAPVERLRSATREAFVHLVDQAIERRVAFVLIAGDLYDGDWKDYNTGLFFVSQMVRLKKAGIRVFLIQGNHDAASQISRALRLPDHVSVFSASHPETKSMDDLKVAVHGQGFASRSVEQNLVKNYPAPRPGYFNIGMLHTSATGREGHENYAPCSVDDLIEKGYDYWALGHIHKREVLHKADPVILFPGNIQGRHINESGEKGCTLVTVADGAVETLESLRLDVLSWTLCELDVSGNDRLDDLFDAARTRLEQAYRQADGRLLAVRIRILGVTRLHEELVSQEEALRNEMRSLAFDVGGGDIWVEKVKIETSDPIDVDQLLNQDTPLAAMMDCIRRASTDDAMLHEWLGAFSDLKRALPADLKKGRDGFSFDGTDVLAKQIPAAEALIRYYLAHSEMSVL